MPGGIAQRMAARAADAGPRRPWLLAYEAAARAIAWFLLRGDREATAYVRGSLGGGEVAPGVSDIDLAIVAADPEGRQRIRRRLGSLRRVGWLAALAGDPRVLEQGSMRRATRSSALTCGLNDFDRGDLAYSGPGDDQDTAKLRERPGLTGPAEGWRRLRGPDRTPAAPARDRQAERIAAWLELQFVLRAGYRYCANPRWRGASRMAMKLVAEPARILLRLERGEAPSRARALALVAAADPAGAETIEAVRAATRRGPDSGAGALAAALPLALRLSERVSALIEAEIAGAGRDQVEMDAGAGLVLPDGAWRPPPWLPPQEGRRTLPLADWRAIVRPHLLDEAMVPVAGDAADPGLLGALARSAPKGPQPVVARGALLLAPAAQWWRSALRAIEAPFSDPAARAVLAGDRTASFPAVRGWAARDVALRAVAEHAGWLRLPGVGAADRRLALGRLIAAARAGIFLESLQEGAPVLPLTSSATLARLAERPGCRETAEAAAEAHASLAAGHRPPPERVLLAMERAVGAMAAYGGRRGAAAPPVETGA